MIERQIEVKRDNTLDTFRGLAMVWVVVIHNLYHLPFMIGGTVFVLKSLLLWEMPLFFFISGAANSCSSANNLQRFYANRIQRILIPYWIYGAVCILANICAVLIMNSELSFSIKTVISWLIPLDIQQSKLPYLSWSMWFIPIYLAAILLFPVLRIFSESKNSAVKLIPISVLVILVILLGFFEIDNRYLGKILDYSRTIVFYSVFVYWGCFWRNLTSNTQKQHMLAVIISVSSIISVALTVVFADASVNMQVNKFPPNFTFLLFSVATMCILYVFHIKIVTAINIVCRVKLLNWVFNQYKEHCYTIFLFHSFAILAVKLLLTVFEKQYGYVDNRLLLLTLPLTIIGSSVLGFAFGRIEKIKIL